MIDVFEPRMATGSGVLFRHAFGDKKEQANKGNIQLLVDCRGSKTASLKFEFTTN